MSIVSLALAKSHITIMGSSDDDLIQLYLDAAESYLGNHIGKPIVDIDPVPADLKLAVLKLAAFYYYQREAVGFGEAMRIAPYGVLSVANAYRERWFGEAPAND
jgi:uncharacterized phage protein (predicted DNA packaging)